LVDDDRALTQVLTMVLEDAGFATELAHDGRRGWVLFQAAPPDVVVLDLLMPELDGMELCKRIRLAHTTPIIMLTSRDEEMDETCGSTAEVSV
jgi:DNA-binding response OmpR family regulator